MNKDPDRLYKLLPSIYRQRDAEQDWPLMALLRVIAEQVNAVEDDIAQLYENWFIETCQDWVVPYIGDLIGYQVVHEAGEPGDVTTQEGQLRNKILIPRRDVANTIRHRRRKGTLSLLEQLASDVAGWTAYAVEFYKLLGWLQHINAPRLQRGRTANLRKGDALEHLNGPFDELAHTVDVRSVASHRTIGRYNIPSVGLFVWRLNVYSVTHTRARGLEDIGDEFYTFSILGNDTPLYTRPAPPAKTVAREEWNFPTAISRRLFERQKADYYGENKSLYIWTGTPEQQEVDEERREEQMVKLDWKKVSLDRIVPAHLGKWKHYRLHDDQVAVDPELGRIAFPPDNIPARVRVLYHYAFSADIGGGEYNRPLIQSSQSQIFQVSKDGEIRTIHEALHKWHEARDKITEPGPHHAVIEITDSGVYIEVLRLSLAQDEHLQIRAGNRSRPVIFLEDEHLDRTDRLRITGPTTSAGTSGSRLTLDGLLIFGRGVEVEGNLAELTIRHCTLVPGMDLGPDCEPKDTEQASLRLINTNARISIEHSILGPIRVLMHQTRTDPLHISISDSILDAMDPEHAGLWAEEEALVAHVVLKMVRCTVFGQVKVRAIDLAENSIFYGNVSVAHRQIGCMRFCSVPHGSRTPRRYNCQPDLAEQAVRDSTEMKNASQEELIAARERERDRVRPRFNSMRYGRPDYCQLADDCPQEIRRGADDEAEMGVFHDLFQPQREANLRARLDEFTPAGMETGIIYVN